jgi:HAD superfamily hydrolase (TIGR01509 family)
MIIALIFDMDGLLLDSERLIRDALIQAAADFGYEVSEEVHLRVVGRTVRDAERILKEHFGKAFPFDEILTRIKSIVLSETQKRGWPPKPGARELLRTLADRDIPCIVVTSTEKEEAISRLASAGLLDFFQGVCGGDEVSRGKPAPDLFLLASERLEIPAAHCLVIEDSDSGAQAAHAVGMKVILVPDLKEPDTNIQNLVLGVFDSLLDASETIISLLGGT